VESTLNPTVEGPTTLRLFYLRQPFAEWLGHADKTLVVNI